MPKEEYIRRMNNARTLDEFIDLYMAACEDKELSEEDFNEVFELYFTKDCADFSK